jgi:Trypsin
MFFLEFVNTFGKLHHLLLAAHCVIADLIPKTWFLTQVRLGEWDRATNPDCQEIDSVYYCADRFVEINIASIYSHEFYQKTDKNKFYDIAILKLESIVEFTDFVRPICIDLDSSVNTFYGTVTAIGFGKTEFTNTSQRMLKADVDIVNHRDCKRKYRSQGRQIADSQICAIKYQTDTW